MSIFIITIFVICAIAIVSIPFLLKYKEYEEHRDTIERKIGDLLDQIKKKEI